MDANKFTDEELQQMIEAMEKVNGMFRETFTDFNSSVQNIEEAAKKKSKLGNGQMNTLSNFLAQGIVQDMVPILQFVVRTCPLLFHVFFPPPWDSDNSVQTPPRWRGLMQWTRDAR